MRKQTKPFLVGIHFVCDPYSLFCSVSIIYYCLEGHSPVFVLSVFKLRIFSFISALEGSKVLSRKK